MSGLFVSLEEAAALGLLPLLQGGCQLVHGTLGTVPVIVEINLYVQKRMTHRDILIEEILELLARPISSHRPGKQNGRHEVAHRIGQRFLVAVYSRSSSNVVPVVTVYQE